MNNIRALIEVELKKVENKLSSISNEDNDILRTLEFFINGLSKRVRSVVTLLYLKAYNTVINDDIIAIITAGELIHNASLLHDDVIDESELRRGEVSFYKKYNPKIAVLSGDYLLSEAVKIILKLNNNQILNLFAECTKKMSLAELYQYDKRGKQTNIEEYIQIVEGKTASLFETILESVCLLNDIELNRARKFGNIFGILFQINNDMQPGSCENDSRNRIMTIVNILGIENANRLKDNYKEEIRSIISNLPDNKYRKALRELTEKL